jgi:cell division protein FtsQ
MDGRGRDAQPLNGKRRSRVRASDVRAAKRSRWLRRERLYKARALFGDVLHRYLAPLLGLKLPRYAGVWASFAIIAASTTYGVVKGDHISPILDELRDWRDAGANAAGFRITGIALGGNRQVTREEVLATAGVTGRASLLFLDVLSARDKLKTNPWISDATVLKLYPGALQISVKERGAFALWQKDGRVAVIASDGTVLEPFVANRFTRLPLVVGQGAETQAQEFLAVLGRYPEIGGQVRASILIAERRWNLRLKNGVDVRLPESGVEEALANLVKLERDKKLISRDITAIDLRVPDRVTVQLSDAAAAARNEQFKDKKDKKKGSNA